MRRGSGTHGPGRRGDRRFGRIAILAGVLAAVTLLAADAGALPPGDVIVASNTTSGQRVALSAVDGNGLETLACGGDLTHGGAPRRFVRLEPVGGQYPDGHDRTELFAYDESCGSRTQLTDDATLGRVEPRWSPDGRRLAYGASWYRPGEPVVHGIFVRDEQVMPDGSVVGVERLAVVLGTPHVFPSWSGDSCRVTYHHPVGPSGVTDVFVADLCGSLPATPTNVTGTPNAWEWQPAFSTAANQIVFAKPTSKAGVVRNDLFVLDLGAPSRLQQVTDKSNANVHQIGYPSWSPDGTSIAFSGWLPSGAESDLYRIRADGRQKAVNLTSTSSDNYAAPLWRR